MLDRRKQEQHRREERREFADCENACLRLEQRKHHDDGNAAHGDQLSQRRARRLDLLSLQRQILEEFVDLTEALALVFIAVINFDNALTVIRLLNSANQLAETTLLLCC